MHKDQFHFSIYGNGALLATDGGYGQDSKYRTYLTTPEAHNIITLNGKSVTNETDPYIPVRSAYELATNHFAFAQKAGDFMKDDRTVEGTHTRAIAFPGQEYFVVADQVTASGGPGIFNMYLHSLGSLQLDGNHAQWSITKKSSLELTDRYGMNEAKMETYIFPKNAVITSKDGVVSLYKEDIKDTYLEVNQKGERAKYLTVLVPQNKDDAAPVVEDASNDHIISAKVTNGDTSDIFILRDADDQIGTSGRLSSNADFAWLREKKSRVTDWMIRQGTIVEVNGVNQFQSAIPMTAVFHQDAKEWLLTVSDAAEETNVRLRIPSDVKVNDVSVQGEKIDFSIDESGSLSWKVRKNGDYNISVDEPRSRSKAVGTIASVIAVLALGIAGFMFRNHSR
jgi:hypothetical protein